MQHEIVEEKPINLATVHEELKKIQKRDKELSFRANKTLEYLHAMELLPVSKAKELTKELEELEIPRLKSIHIAKIVDTLPKSSEELKMILQGYTITIKQDNLKKIVESVKKFL